MAAFRHNFSNYSEFSRYIFRSGKESVLERDVVGNSDKSPAVYPSDMPGVIGVFNLHSERIV